jgi:hypothetical protein
MVWRRGRIRERIVASKDGSEIGGQSGSKLSGSSRERTIWILETRDFVLLVSFDDGLVKKKLCSCPLEWPKIFCSAECDRLILWREGLDVGHITDFEGCGLDWMGGGFVVGESEVRA